MLCCRPRRRLWPCTRGPGEGTSRGWASGQVRSGGVSDGWSGFHTRPVLAPAGWSIPRLAPAQLRARTLACRGRCLSGCRRDWGQRGVSGGDRDVRYTGQPFLRGPERGDRYRGDCHRSCWRYSGRRVPNDERWRGCVPGRDGARDRGRASDGGGRRGGRVGWLPQRRRVWRCRGRRWRWHRRFWNLRGRGRRWCLVDRAGVDP